MSIGWWSPFCTPLTEAIVRRRVQRVPGVFVLFERVKGSGWVFRRLAQDEDLMSALLDETAVPRDAGEQYGFSWIEVTEPREREGVAGFLSLALSRGGSAEAAREPIRVALPPLPAQPTPAPYL